MEFFCLPFGTCGFGVGAGSVVVGAGSGVVGACEGVVTSGTVVGAG